VLGQAIQRCPLAVSRPASLIPNGLGKGGLALPIGYALPRASHSEQAGPGSLAPPIGDPLCPTPLIPSGLGRAA